MRIAFLCKRKYMSKDVILDRYARLYEIPYQLARLGHEVRGFCFSYQQAESGNWQHEAAPGALTWRSTDRGKLFAPSLLTYPRSLLRELRSFKPDLIIAASDIPHVVLGHWLARKLGVPFVADLYDNFEGFGQARIPGFVPLLRHAVRNADLVLTTSEPLRDMVEKTYLSKGKVVAMPSTIDTDVFKPLDKKQCRIDLGLPEEGVLIGTAGGLLEERGIGELYQAWPQISIKYPEAHLVLAGPTDPSLPPPDHERVHYLGMLPHADTAKLFSALDVGVIYLRDTLFGRYCFPQKAYEMQACHLPVIATAVGVMPYLMSSVPDALYQEQNIDSLTKAITYQIKKRKRMNIDVNNWQKTISILEKRLVCLFAGAHKKRLVGIGTMEDDMDNTEATTAGFQNLAPDAFTKWAGHYIKCESVFVCDDQFSPVPFFLLTRSIELSLKAIHCKEKRQESVRSKYSHRFVAAYNDLSTDLKILSQDELKTLKETEDMYIGKAFEYYRAQDALEGYSSYPNLSELRSIACKIYNMTVLEVAKQYNL